MATSTKAAAPAPPPKAPEGEEQVSESNPLYVLDRFLWVPREAGGETVTAERLTRYRVRFLVATVPDPLDSHLAQNFDRAVDSIQRGVQESGYLLDSWWLPWKKDADPQWRISFSPTWEWTATSKPAPRVQHRETPGVLLFRGSGVPHDRSELLVAFLVGETPTTGVQRKALVASFEAIHDCNTFRPGRLACEGGSIPFLGPYFSGSAESIRETLQFPITSGRDIEMISGSATVPSNQERLKGFHATVIPDDALRDVFLEYLNKELGLRSKSVALFVEGSTPYGSAAAKDSPEDFRFVLQFPLHVSQLRQAYQKDEALKGSGILNRGPRRTLELPLESSEADPKDIVTLLDPGMASNVAELTLAAGIETIRREHVRLVGIVATDPRDVLFLARKIREAAANVTLFTYGADILFVHPDYQRFLRGMLVVTPYPLFPMNQRWTGSGSQRVAFAGSTEEGIYNAVKLLLAGMGDPELNLHLMEYGSPVGPGRRRPPVWITAVGRGGFWPVSFDWKYINRDYVYPSLVRSPNIEAWKEQYRYWPPGAVVTFLLVDLFFGALVYFYVRVRIQRLAVYESAEKLLGIWDEPLGLRVNRVFVTTLFGLALIVQLTLLTWFLASRPYAQSDSDVGLGLALVLFVVLGMIVFREIQAFARDDAIQPADRTTMAIRFPLIRSLSPGRWIRYTAFLAPIAVLVAIFYWLVRYLAKLWSMGEGAALTFGARALDLTSTLSPVVPFLLTMLVLLLWATCNLQRALLLAVQPPLEPSDAFPSLKGLEQLRAKVLDCVANPSTRALLLLAPIVAVVPFLRTIQRNYWAIDGESWSHLMKGLLLSCHFVVVYTFAVFVLLWVRLKRLLRRLAVHPLADAFRRLPVSCAATPWKLWHAVPDVTTLAASVAQLRVVANLAQGYVPAPYPQDLETQATGTEALLKIVFEREPMGFATSLEARLNLRRSLAIARSTVLERLEEVWQRWPERSARRLPKWGSEDRNLGIPEWKRREVPSGEALWARAAEEFIALRESAFIRIAFLHMKNLLGFVFFGFVLVLAAIGSYPFEPRQSVMALVWVVILTSVALIAWVFMEMERDPILSSIGKTEPGKVTLSLEFLGTLAVYVGLPLVTLIATQFPGIGDVVYSIFNPAMRSLSH